MTILIIHWLRTVYVLLVLINLYSTCLWVCVFVDNRQVRWQFVCITAAFTWPAVSITLSQQSLWRQVFIMHLLILSRHFSDVMSVSLCICVSLSVCLPACVCESISSESRCDASSCIIQRASSSTGTWFHAAVSLTSKLSKRGMHSVKSCLYLYYWGQWWQRWRRYWLIDVHSL